MGEDKIELEIDCCYSRHGHSIEGDIVFLLWYMAS